MHYFLFEKRGQWVNIGGRHGCCHGANSPYLERILPSAIDWAQKDGTKVMKTAMKFLKSRGLLVLVLMGLAWPGGQAAARDDRARPVPDLFTVHGVPVDETARNATLARARAIRDGQVRAFTRLMARIAEPEQASKLDDLGVDRIVDLVIGIQFHDERSSQVRYIADLTVRFNGERVRKLLKEHEIPFTQTMASSLMVVPVLEYAGARLLWEKENAWFAAWREQDLANLLTPYVLPDGSVTDRLTLNHFQATAQEAGQRRVLARNYGADGVFVPVAEVRRDFAQGGHRVTVTWRHDSLGLAEAPAGEAVAPVEKNVKQTFRSRDGETVEDLLLRTAAGVIARRDAIWKERTLIRMDETRRMALKVPLRNMGDWSAVQEKLEAVTLVQSAKLIELSAGEAALTLSYAGRADQLVLALAQNDLVLRSHGDDVYLFPAALAQARSITPEYDFAPVEEALAVTPPDALELNAVDGESGLSDSVKPRGEESLAPR